jgi:hypothetical protein
MKVCFVSHSSAKAGAERCLIETIEALKDCRVEACVLLPKDGPLAGTLADRNVPFRVIRYFPWLSERSAPLWTCLAKMGFNLVGAMAAAREIRRRGCDVVYSNTITVCVGALAAALLRRPHVWHIHELIDCEQRSWRFCLGKKLSLKGMNRLTDVFVAVSRAVLANYEPHFG